METETEWKARLVKTRGAYCVLSVHGHMMQSPGWPDLFVAPHLWIELKLETGVIAPVQVKRIRAINNAGGRALFVERRGEDVVYTDKVMRVESSRYILCNIVLVTGGAKMKGYDLFLNLF